MLKNFIKLFLSIWIILIVISFAVKTLAEEHLNGPVYDYLTPTPVPLYCGETAKVFATTTIDFRMKMLGYSEVRNEGRKDGKLLANKKFHIQTGLAFLSMIYATFLFNISQNINHIWYALLNIYSLPFHMNYYHFYK